MTAQDGAARRAVSEESPDDVLPELYRQLRWRMGLVLYRYRIPVDHGEDLIQTAFVLGITRWTEIRNPTTWLLGTLTNRCILYWRARRLEPGRKPCARAGSLAASNPLQP